MATEQTKESDVAYATNRVGVFSNTEVDVKVTKTNTSTISVSDNKQQIINAVDETLKKMVKQFDAKKVVGLVGVVWDEWKKMEDFEKILVSIAVAMVVGALGFNGGYGWHVISGNWDSIKGAAKHAMNLLQENAAELLKKLCSNVVVKQLQSPFEEQSETSSVGIDDVNNLVETGAHSKIKMTQSIGDENLDSDPLQSIDFLLSHEGFILAHPSHRVISILQHLSKKPWVQFDFNGTNIVKDLRTEWQQLSEGCVGEYLQFFVDLKESVAEDKEENGMHGVYLTFRKYIKKEFTCYVCTYKDCKIAVMGAFRLSPCGEIVEVANEASSLELFDENGANIFIYLDENYPHRSRLVTKYELMYPDLFHLGEKLIDQIDQFRLISTASKNRWTGDISTVISSTECFDEVNSIIKNIERSQTFREILINVLPPTSMESTIIRKLVRLEHQLSPEEKLQLRIKLIEVATTELFYPLRKTVLIEKEKQETAATESADILRCLQKESKYLAIQVASTEMKLKKAELKISKARKDIESMKKSMDEIDTRKDEQAKVQLQKLKLQDMKEKMAFNKFVLDLPSRLRPEKTVQNLEQISKLSEHLTVSDLIERIVDIFEIEEETANCPFLEDRVARNEISDKEELFRVLEDMKQLCHIDIVESDLNVQGGYVILSSILPQIFASLQRNPHIRQITIDVSGVDGQNHIDSKAKDGINYGDNGEDGLPGEHGQHGGNIHLEAIKSIVNIDNIILKCNGGNGANGQHGGDGHCGRNGENGENGQVESPKIFCKYYAINRGESGKPGQPGGLGGSGGAEGKGGKGGLSKIVSASNTTPREQKHKDGRSGCKGECGTQGQNGIHGMVGKDEGRFARSIFHGWEYMTGYNLEAVEIAGWLWKVAGYYIVEGNAPPVERAQNKTRQASKQRQATKQQEQQHIQQNTIHFMKQSVNERKTAANSSGQNGAEIIMNQEVQQSVNSLTAIASEQQQFITQKTATLKQIEVGKSTLSGHLADLESRLDFVEHDIQSAKRDAENAEMRVVKMGKLSLLLREKYEQALESGKVTQRQMQQELHNEREFETSKQDSSAPQDPEDTIGESVVISNGLTLSFPKEHAKSSEFQEFLDLCTNNKVPFNVQDVLESCWQRIEKTDKNSKKLISFLCANGHWEYIQNYLASDLLVARNLTNKKDKSSTLAEYIMRKRLGLEENEYEHKDNEELKTFLDSMEMEIKATSRLQSWISKSPNEGSPLAKVPPEHLTTYKASVIATVREVFFQLIQFVGKNVDEGKFLDDLIAFIEKNAEELSPEQALSTYLEQHESMNASDIKEKLLHTYSKQHESTNASNTEQESFSLLPLLNTIKNAKRNVCDLIWKSESGKDPKKNLAFVHFALTNVRYTMKELEEIENLLADLRKHAGAEIQDSLKGLFELLDKSYTKELEQLKKEIRDECCKYKVIPLEALCRIECMLDSPYAGFSFMKKQKRYEELKSKISSESSFVEWLRDIYPSSHGKYVIDGTFDFSKFSKYLQRQLSKPIPKNGKINQLKLHLETGKLDKFIEPFSKTELAEIENHLWECLNKDNVKTVHEMALLIGKADSLKLDYARATEKCDVVSCIEKVRMLKEHLIKFIPFENDGSLVTDSGRLKNHLEFLLTHIEFMAMELGDCSSVSMLERVVHSDEVTNIDKAITTLKEFRRENFGCSVQFADILEITEKTDFHAVYLNGLHYVEFSEAEDGTEYNVSNSISESLKKLEMIKANLTESQISNGIRDQVDRLSNLIGFFQKPTTKAGKQLLRNLQTLRTEEYEKHLPVWRSVKSIFDQADKYFHDLAKHTDPPLYIVANFAASTQSDVLDELTLLNVEGEHGKEVRLHLNYPHSEKIRQMIGSDNERLQIGMEVLKKTLAVQQYPFTDILSAMATIYNPQRSIYALQFYEILSKILRQQNSYSHSDLWIQLMGHFKDIEEKAAGMYKNRVVRVHLACLLAKLDFNHELRPLLCRLLKNLMDLKDSKMLSFQRMPNMSPQTTREELVALFEEIEKPIVFQQVFLIPSEVIWYESLCSSNTNQKIHKIITKYDPISWCSHFEQLYFNHTFRLLSTPNVKGSMVDAVNQEFKLTYLLQSTPQRVLFLNIINEMISVSDVRVLESANDCKMFFALLRDIDVNTLRFIVNEKFPQNWLKWILIKCISMNLNHNIKTSDEECKQLEQILCHDLLHNMDRENVNFLLTLHQILKIETNATFDAIMEIIRGVVKSQFSPEEMRDLCHDFEINVLSYWPRIIRIYRLSILCTKQGHSMQIVEKLLGMDETFGETVVETLANSLFIDNDKLLANEKLECLQKYCSTEWILDEVSIGLMNGKGFEEIERNVAEYSHKQRQTELSLDDILKRMKCNPINKNLRSNLFDELKERCELIRKCANEKYEVESRDKAAFGELMNKFSESWREMWQVESPRHVEKNVICNTLAFISRAVEYHYGFYPRDTQLVSVLLLTDGLIKRKPVGKFGVIETGEGKSVIIAMFAALCSLFKYRVHVVTSNKLLAENDASESAGFFEILGLTVSNNCDKDSNPESTRTARYNNNVVYGDLGSFQADKLQTDFFSKKIMEFSPDVTIVDEVDSLLLDKGSNILYISHSIPELRHLRSVFLLIWRTVNAHRISDEKKQRNPIKPYTDWDVHYVRRAVEKKMKDDVDDIQYPECLRSFIYRRVCVWVKQAFKARFMPLNEDFIVEEERHRILTMDNQTGVEEGNMHMSLGLHQFLQLRHKTKLSPESLKCVFMSNHCYFAQHAGTVFGLTGTLGGDEEMNLLFDLYGVEFFAMPRYKLNKRTEEEPVIVNSEDEWMSSILKSVEIHKVKQPILIIAENIANHKKIQRALIGNRILDKSELIDYSSSGKHNSVIKEIANEEGLKVGIVLLSTNLGGRGTDLKIHQHAKKLGMHVIVTFLPPNLRVEKQAFGRTARTGENGTVQFVILTKQKQKTLHGGVDEQQIASIYQLKEERKRIETKRLKIIRDKEFSKIKIQDELFAAYCKFQQQEIQQSNVFLQHKKRIRHRQLEFLNNRWAIWLDSIDESLNNLHLRSGLQHQRIWSEFDSFKTEMVTRMKNKDVKMFADFTSEFVKLGTTYERLAIKWLASSIMSGDCSEASAIFSEWKDKFNSFWNGVKTVFSPTKMDPTEQMKLMDQITQKLNDEKPPSDLEVGLQILKLAVDSEQKFSYAASLYKGMLELQKDPTNKLDAKLALLEAKHRIHSRIEDNYSALTMQDDACIEMQRNQENINVTGPNKFKEQIISENNLFDIHLDAIQSTFHSPITEKFLKTQLSGLDSNEQAKKLLDFLLLKKWNLLIGCRVSKKVGGINSTILTCD
ncbi:Protein translocase subunit SecA [Pseudolycoriella hygida]|uniref:Protein translocase subunit SecA n=1 Tax=Pseudolycoriella hygida TaxID=35572 RepID=A0A9Q0S5G5_9DIPT|nr:Protein translocase subunit SecA [Pseudolycoriella hygida]